MHLSQPLWGGSYQKLSHKLRVCQAEEAQRDQVMQLCASGLIRNARATERLGCLGIYGVPKPARRCVSNLAVRGTLRHIKAHINGCVRWCAHIPLFHPSLCAHVYIDTCGYQYVLSGWQCRCCMWAMSFALIQNSDPFAAPQRNIPCLDHYMLLQPRLKLKGHPVIHPTGGIAHPL